MFTSRDEKQDALVRVPATALVTAESLRSTSALGCGPPQSPKTEEKMPLVWRVFGGTMLSICALACITVYQQFNNGINDMRRDWAAEMIAGSVTFCDIVWSFVCSRWRICQPGAYVDPGAPGLARLR